jgi:hypothetical protein
MSERAARRSRRLPSYLPKILEVYRALGSPRGGVSHILIGHDDDCPRLEGGECNCNPDVRLTEYEPPMTGVN